MSKLFFDHLVVLEEVDSEIKGISKNEEEKAELWHLVDDIVNHKVMIAILDRLPLEHHEEFLTGFHEAPHDERHLHFVNSLVDENIEETIKKEIADLKEDLLKEIRSLKKGK